MLLIAEAELGVLGSSLYSLYSPLYFCVCLKFSTVKKCVYITFIGYSLTNLVFDIQESCSKCIAVRSTNKQMHGILETHDLKL